MDVSLLPLLRTPVAGLHPLTIVDAEPGTSAISTVVGVGGNDGDADELIDGTLAGPDGADRSEVSGGIWHAIGRIRPPRTLARLSNVVAPWPQIYESLWRPLSTPLLTNRRMTVSDELAELDRALPDVDGAFVIDVGCAEGLQSRRLAARGGRLLAVDYSKPLLRRARLRSGRDRVRLSLCQAVAQSLPVLDATADAVVMGGTLNEIGDAGGALTEVARVLKPGGRFFCVSVLQAPTALGRGLQAAIRLSGIAFPNEVDTIADIERTGLSIEDQRITGSMSCVLATKP